MRQRKHDVGNIYTNNKGEQYEIIERILRPDRKHADYRIRFLETGKEKFTTIAGLIQGSVTSIDREHRNVGDIFTNHDGEEYVILEKFPRDETNSDYRVKIKFLHNDLERIISSSSIAKKSVRSETPSEVGTIYQTKYSGDIEVIEVYPGSKCNDSNGGKERKAKIKFLDTGKTKVVRTSSITNMEVEDYRPEVTVGSIIDTISGKAEVIKIAAKGSSLSKYYTIKFLSSGNTHPSVYKSKLLSGILFDIDREDSRLVANYRIKCNPHHYILYKYEYDTITEIVREQGEAFVIAALRTFFKNDTLEFDYIDELKFDTFKAFYKYLVIMDATI